jgi:hypothetical protein
VSLISSPLVQPLKSVFGTDQHEFESGGNRYDYDNS